MPLGQGCRVLGLKYTRCCAGQAVVQMVRSTRNGQEYAIKFFVSRAAFNVERGMYVAGNAQQGSPLAQFLPQVGLCTCRRLPRLRQLFRCRQSHTPLRNRALLQVSAPKCSGSRSADGCFTVQVLAIEANEDGVHVDGGGKPLPPCIEMERGESLDIWAMRAQPDRPLAFAVRTLHSLCASYQWTCPCLLYTSPSPRD